MAHRFTKAYNHSERDTPETRALYSKYFIGKDPSNLDQSNGHQLTVA